MGRAMHEHDAQWEQEFEQWVQPFLAEFGHTRVSVGGHRCTFAG
jgi:hypothetical protein